MIIDGFQIDVASSEEHGFESDVTSHPVESGGDITDHVTPKPVEISVEGVVSNTPIGTVAETRTFLRPAVEFYLRMIYIRNNREPIEITTSLGRYRNMVLRSFRVPRSASTGDALRFSATFQQIEIVDAETARVAVPRAKTKKNLGNKTSEEPGFAKKALLDAFKKNRERTAPPPPPPTRASRDSSILDGAIRGAVL